jgi:phosphoribosylaminoimidazole carboxylase (NCAIR synthetase)
MAELVYKVIFRPGRYKYIRNPVNEASFMIGRDDDGTTIAFTFTENEAAHICMALNLTDAYITNQTEDQMDLLRKLAKLRTH